MKKALIILLASACTVTAQQSYPPDADTPGTTAIHKTSPLFLGWATGVVVERGYVQISDPSIMHMGSNKATYGVPEDAIGIPDTGAVSLGDAGTAIITFASPIGNGPGFDFAVFENGTNTFLELAFVEVSSDGVNYFRFPSHSETQTDTPISGFGALNARSLNNLAGKYKADYGTPFNLDDVPDNSLLNKNSITHVKLIDVVGSLDPQYAGYDSFGNRINDPFPTPFYSGGFDLTGVGVLNTGSLGVADSSSTMVAIYPNPAVDSFSIRMSSATEGHIKMYDSTGREVLSTDITSEDLINVSHLNAGIYIVAIDNGTSITNKRLIIKK